MQLPHLTRLLRPSAGSFPLFAFLLLAFGLWLSASTVAAQTLFGATSSGPSSLYRINPATGAATLVGPIGFDFVSAIDFHPATGVLYGIGSRPGGGGPKSSISVLITINPLTGVGTEVGPTGINNGFPDMSFRPSDNTLFAWSEGDDNPYTINLATGAATLVGPSGIGTIGSALAFSPGNTLFLANGVDSNLYTINQTTGAATPSVALTGLGFRLNAMDFQPGTGVLYAIDNQSSGGAGPYVLVTVNPTTGVATPIGQTQNRMDALAWQGVPPGLNVQAADPAICLDPGGLVGVTATVTNPNPFPAVSTFTATLPVGLTGVAGTCVADVNPGGCAIAANGGSVTWNGQLNAGQTVTIIYRARIATTVAQGATLILNNTANVGGAAVNFNAPVTINCPFLVNTRVSDQKAGSVLVFPYYTSTIGGGSDTRLTISNISGAASTLANQTFVHLFFIDGTTCQQADLFLCLTPNASFSFKASEYDPGNTGYVLAVAVNNQGVPVQNNVLIGNAFVRTNEFADNYGAESFRANGRDFALATVSGNTATLYFDQVGYDAVPKQFAVEIQSPVDVVGQQIVTAGMSGDLTTSTMSGAAQVGTGQAYNEKEQFGSFNLWLTGTCQARGVIATNNPRVPNGLGNLIKTGQAGSLKFNVGGAVGLLLTPRTATWRGIRTLHKTQTTATTITIPILIPVC